MNTLISLYRTCFQFFSVCVENCGLIFFFLNMSQYICKKWDHSVLLKEETCSFSPDFRKRSPEVLPKTPNVLLF